MSSERKISVRYLKWKERSGMCNDRITVHALLTIVLTEARVYQENVRMFASTDMPQELSQ